MWKNLQREYEQGVAHSARLQGKDAHIQPTLSKALVKVVPNIRSDLMARVPAVATASRRAACSPPVLGQGNADWLAINIVSNAMPESLATRFWYDTQRYNVLLDSLNLKDDHKTGIEHSFLPCHLTVFGNEEDMCTLFRECVALVPYIEEVVTNAVATNIEYELRKSLSAVSVGRVAVETTYRKSHTFNAAKPEVTSNGTWSIAHSKVFVQNSKSHIRVHTTQGLSGTSWFHSFVLPVTFKKTVSCTT